ncbi:MAG: helix-turn-helix domain-containing protein [Bacteroidales bacterium]|nr:helix-turn-helix domain-containing protein [Bacteroidales bacterium]
MDHIHNGFHYTTLEEALDEHFGKVGTPRRDEFERDVEEHINAYKIGEAIRQLRLKQHLTQEQLGSKIGVKKSWISKIEHGDSVTITTLGRVFKALGVSTAHVDLGEAGQLTLWE